MSVHSSTSNTPEQVDWRRAEFVLTGLAILGFVTIGISLKTIPGEDLPAHPLFIHVPVIMIPLSVIGSLLCVWRRRWFSTYGILLCLGAIVAMSSIFLAIQAGGQLQTALHLTGFPAHLISEHSQAAGYLAVAFVLFTATLILTFSAHRISGGMLTGLAFVDRLLGSKSNYLALRVALVILALISAALVYRVGDLGAKAVWAGRLQAAARGAA